MNTKTKSTTYGYIARVFLKIGMQAFSGWPMAALLVEKELVEKAQRLTAKQYQGAFAYAHFIPGATQIAFVSNVGYNLKGFGGATLATVCYLLPALILMALFSVVYFRYLQSTQFADHMAGLSAALGGVILANAYRIGKGHASRPSLWLLVVVAFGLKLWLGINTVLIILVFGIGGAIISFVASRRKTT